MTELPLTQAQDHDRRIGRLEGMAEQFVEQGRQNNARLDRIEQAIAEQGRELRQAIAAANEATNNRIEATNNRMDKQFRWFIGIQITTLLALGTLILLRLP